MPKKIRVSDSQLQKKRKENLIQSCIITDIALVYFFMLLGHGFAVNTDETGLNVIIDVLSKFPLNMLEIFPTKITFILAAIVIGALIDVVMYDGYLKKKDVVQKPHGDAAFEEDFDSYNKEFVIDPKIVEKVIGKKPKTYNLQQYDQEYKDVVASPKIKQNLKDKIFKACWDQTQLYADGVALSLNGSWCQRNSNAVIFGASGSGKSRYFLNPNLLQANSNYVITDPSGEIMSGYGAFLREQGYMVKCLNISDMEHSCRFNPLYYIQSASDIPVIATTLMENTNKTGKTGGDDFWPKTTQALLCCCIGYLYEVCPLEQRNFYNVLEILNMARANGDDEDAVTPFDELFEKLGKNNPSSYAYNQYLTVTTAPRKTLNNILISTAILLSTFINIDEFNNLTYKDNMDLFKVGAAPFKLAEGEELFPEDVEKYEERYTEKYTPLERGYIDVEDFKKYKDKIEKVQVGDSVRYVEGKPYKVAIFLCIPTADTTYNWLTAMLYSIVFKLIYRRGETRQSQQVISNPKLAYPVRLLIDECANSVTRSTVKTVAITDKAVA